jgi:serine/threonine protein phosphatase 1
MSRFLAVGDIHGCAKTFEHLLMHEFQLKMDDTVVCLGDYIDRGPDSKGVIDLILGLRQSGHIIHTLRGNHEELMMTSVNSLEIWNRWTANGGNQTQASFGIQNYGELDNRYKTFFETTFHYLVHENFIFTHAGLNLHIEDPFEDKSAMLWIRGVQSTSFLDGRVLVHGHTPIKLDAITAQQNANIINIDGGCVYHSAKGFGHLVGYSIMEEKFISTKNEDFEFTDKRNAIE